MISLNNKIALITSSLLLISLVLVGNRNGSIGGFTSLNGIDGKTCSNNGNCHSGGSINLGASTLSTNIPITGYQLDSIYEVTLNSSQQGINTYGFEIASENIGASQRVGEFVSTNTNVKILAGGSGIGHVTHTGQGTAGYNDSITWSFKWKAPSINLGDVVFRSITLAADGNGLNSNDDIILAVDTFVIAQDASIQQQFQYNITYWPNPSKESIHIKFDNYHKKEITIYSIHGKHILDVVTKDESLILSLNKFDKGDYYMVINLEGQIQYKRFIVY